MILKPNARMRSTGIVDASFMDKIHFAFGIIAICKKSDPDLFTIYHYFDSEEMNKACEMASELGVPCLPINERALVINSKFKGTPIISWFLRKFKKIKAFGQLAHKEILKPKGKCAIKFTAWYLKESNIPFKATADGCPFIVSNRLSPKIIERIEKRLSHIGIKDPIIIGDVPTPEVRKYDFTPMYVETGARKRKVIQIPEQIKPAKETVIREKKVPAALKPLLSIDERLAKVLNKCALKKAKEAEKLELSYSIFKGKTDTIIRINNYERNVGFGKQLLSALKTQFEKENINYVQNHTNFVILAGRAS